MEETFPRDRSFGTKRKHSPKRKGVGEIFVNFARLMGIIGPKPIPYDFRTDPTLSRLEQDFFASCETLEAIKEDISFSDWLIAYALYKQATVGDCNMIKPSALFKKKLYKYMAWKSRLGMSPAEATVRYVQYVKGLKEARNIPEEPTKQAAFHSYEIQKSKSRNTNLEKKQETLGSAVSVPQKSKPPPFQAPQPVVLTNPKLANLKVPDEPSRDTIQRILKPTGAGSDRPNRPIRPSKRLEEPPRKGSSDEFPFKSNGKRYNRERASVELNLFLSWKNEDTEKDGLAYKNIDNLDADLAEIEPSLFANFEEPRTRNPHPPPSSQKNKNTALLVAPHQSNTSRGSIRDRYLATEAEYKRFTMLKMNSTVISSQASFISFVRPEYSYRGPSLEQLVQQGQKSGDKFMARSFLLDQLGAEAKYNQVVAIVHRIAVDYEREMANARVVVKPDDFAAKEILKVPLDKFLFRLIRYLDRWFEDPPGINSAGARSAIITRIYLNRLKQSIDDFVVTQLKIFKLLSVCMLLAAKYCEDCIIANSYWAQVAGISVEELNKVEEVFCNATHFDLYVKNEEMEAMCKTYDLILNKGH